MREEHAATGGNAIAAARRSSCRSPCLFSQTRHTTRTEPSLVRCPAALPADVKRMTMAHIHLGNASTNGNPIVILLPIGGVLSVRVPFCCVFAPRSRQH